MIDTAAKRRAAAGLVFMPLPQVTPDAAQPVAWRQQAVGTYSGIAPDEPVTPTATLRMSHLFLCPRMRSN